MGISTASMGTTTHRLGWQYALVVLEERIQVSPVGYTAWSNTHVTRPIKTGASGAVTIYVSDITPEPFPQHSSSAEAWFKKTPRYAEYTLQVEVNLGEDREDGWATLSGYPGLALLPLLGGQQVINVKDIPVDTQFRCLITRTHGLTDLVKSVQVQVASTDATIQP